MMLIASLWERKKKYKRAGLLFCLGAGVTTEQWHD